MLEDKTQTKGDVQNAILVAVTVPGTGPEVVEEHLTELAFLAETAGIQTEKRFIQRLEHPDVRTFVGKGKLEEMKEYAFNHQVTSVIFDDDLSPSQLRNLEREFNPAGREDKVRVY